MTGPDLAVRDVGMRDLLELLWRFKRTIAIVSALFGALAAIYALLATSWYRADVLLAPADPKSTQGLSSQLGNLGGIASLAGLNLSGANSATNEALAVLQSRDFARAFLEEEGILPAIYAKQRGSLGKYLAINWDDKAPDVRDAVKY